MALFSAIGTAIAGIGAWIGTLGAVGSFLLKTAVGIGLNLLAQAIAGKPKDPTFSINGTLQAGGDISRSFILGKTATAGSLVWVNTWGHEGDTPNAYLTQVIALADYPVQTLDEVWVNNEKVTLDTTPHGVLGHPVIQYRKDGKDHLWVKFHDGAQTEVDFNLVANATNSQRQWQSSRIGRGVAYAVVTALGTQNLFSGVPAVKFVVTGAKLYDPSKDSTKAGGSGSQRENNPATWGGDGDHNPAVQIYNLLRGIDYNGQWFYGLQGVTSSRLPSVNWIAQINKCRAGNIYRAGGEIPVEAPLANAIEGLLTACQGRIAEVGGVYNVYVGEPDAAVASFHDDDILSTEEQSFTPFFGLADTINGIAATYPSPNDGWSVKAAPPLHRTDLEVLAGNRRLMADVSLDFVPYPEQVQRLMKSALAEGQRARRHTLVLPPKFWPYAVPGAILSWTSPRNGYVNKLFRVDGAVDRANLDVMVDLTEVDPADYDWNPSTDYKVPVDGAVGVLRPPSMPLVGWQVFPATIGNPGKELPSIRVAYPGQLNGISGVRVAVRLAGETKPFFSGDIPYGDPATNDVIESTILYGQFTPNTDHEVRGILLPYGDLVTSWSEWLPVTTPDVWISDVYDVDLDMLADDIKGWQLWAGEGLREVERRLEEFDLWMADQDLGNRYERHELQQQVTATYDDARAEWKYDVTVIAAENYALSQRVEQLDAEVFDPDTGLPAVASAVSGLEAYAGPGGPLAQAFLELSAATDTNNVSTMNWRAQVTAEPGGINRWAIGIRTGGAGAYRGAGFGVDLPANPSDPSLFWADAQSFALMDTSTGATINPLIYSGGVWRANNFRIGFAQIDNVSITSAQIANAAITNAKIANGAITSAKIENGSITSAKIGFAEIADGNIAAGAVTNANHGSNTINLPPTGAWQTVLTLPIASPGGNPVMIYYNIRVTNSGTGALGTGWRLLRNGTIIKQGSGAALAEKDELIMDAAGVGNHTYELVAQRNEGALASATGSLILQCNKK